MAASFRMIPTRDGMGIPSAGGKEIRWSWKPPGLMIRPGWARKASHTVRRCAPSSRYRRVDHTTIQFNLTIDDPKTYTKTWEAEPRVIKLKPGVEIPESFCVASEEEEFAKRIREPAARQTK